MRISRVGILVLAIALPTAALAQGSGSTGGSRPSGGVSYPGDSSFAVTRSVKGTIAEVDGEKALLFVEDKNGKRFQFSVDETTKLKADKNTALHGRNDLSLNDFLVGQTVEVTYRASDGRAIELKLKPDKKNKG